jgi:hypothetical protein
MESSAVLVYVFENKYYYGGKLHVIAHVQQKSTLYSGMHYNSNF